MKQSNIQFQSAAIAVVVTIALLLVFAGCVEDKSIPPALEALAGQIRQDCETGKAEELMKLVYAPNAPDELIQGMKASIGAFLAGGRLKISDANIYPFSDYQPTTGAPGNFNGKALKWAVKPSHWIVLKGTVPPPNPDSPVTTRITLEFAMVQHDGKWFMVGPK